MKSALTSTPKEARGLDAHASGQLTPQYVGMRADMVKQAVGLYTRLLNDGFDTPVGQEAKKRLPVLQKLLDEK